MASTNRDHDDAGYPIPGADELEEDQIPFDFLNDRPKRSEREEHSTLNKAQQGVLGRST